MQIAPPPAPVSKIKSFGHFDPKFEVGQALRQLNDGDWMVDVTMVESGEQVEYRLSGLADDPDAH